MYLCYIIPRLLKDENLSLQIQYELNSYFKPNCKTADVQSLLWVILSIKMYCT